MGSHPRLVHQARLLLNERDMTRTDADMVISGLSNFDIRVTVRKKYKLHSGTPLPLVQDILSSCMPVGLSPEYADKFCLIRRAAWRWFRTDVPTRER